MAIIGLLMLPSADKSGKMAGKALRATEEIS